MAPRWRIMWRNASEPLRANSARRTSKTGCDILLVRVSPIAPNCAPDDWRPPLSAYDETAAGLLLRPRFLSSSLYSRCAVHPMRSYRFVQQTLDEEVVGEQFSSCGDDDTALAFANALLAAHPVVEVWRGQRFVGRMVQPSAKA